MREASGPAPDPTHLGLVPPTWACAPAPAAAPAVRGGPGVAAGGWVGAPMVADVQLCSVRGGPQGGVGFAPGGRGQGRGEPIWASDAPGSQHGSQLGLALVIPFSFGGRPPPWGEEEGEPLHRPRDGLAQLGRRRRKLPPCSAARETAVADPDDQRAIPRLVLGRLPKGDQPATAAGQPAPKRVRTE